ncbi:hypothetical protein SVI_3888 [Shewanella violacea DSS12]|uniref:Uncharacterized protein n=1 Tax=Shewanella violacea (strain JCM 10179 / CIP 106290 / LMG 19151 / DSS12) TaxID=637905 RepID=D4ZCW4_SHEVD|nr:hypothetical protein SVI_3888 [Shewanella violacea DSS12]
MAWDFDAHSLVYLSIWLDFYVLIYQAWGLDTCSIEYLRYS